MAPKLLVVLSSHVKTEGGLETGWYLPELAHPYYVLEGKVDMVVASPKGGEAPLNPGSVESFKEDAESTKLLKEQTGLWKQTVKLSDVAGKVKDFAGVFYVGGHGPMFDLASDETSQQLIRDFYESGKIVAAICHGPAALVNVKLSDGSYLVHGKETTVLTNAEEDILGGSSQMPFMLETRMAERGATVLKVEPFGAKVVTSGEGGRLITGQNPASGEGLGEAILAAL